MSQTAWLNTSKTKVKDWHGTNGVYALNLGKRLVSPALLSLFHSCFCDKIRNQKKFREGKDLLLYNSRLYFLIKGNPSQVLKARAYMTSTVKSRRK